MIFIKTFSIHQSLLNFCFAECELCEKINLTNRENKEMIKIKTVLLRGWSAIAKKGA